MKLNVKAVAATSAIVWGGCIFATGVANVIQPKYGREFLRMMESVYPGYKARPEMKQVAVGTGYAAVDGFLGGALFAWLYNCLQ